MRIKPLSAAFIAAVENVFNNNNDRPTSSSSTTTTNTTPISTNIHHNIATDKTVTKKKQPKTKLTLVFCTLNINSTFCKLSFFFCWIA